jgi:multidrug transporter EmrE-like cation transporter
LRIENWASETGNPELGLKASGTESGKLKVKILFLLLSFFFLTLVLSEVEVSVTSATSVTESFAKLPSSSLTDRKF